MNSKVNNWVVELEQFRLHLEWIPGTRNLLVDSLSRLLDVVPDAQKSKELEDQEFSSYCFEELEPAKVMETVSTEVIELMDNSKYQNDSQESQKTLEKPGEKKNNTDENEAQNIDSESSEHSLNSRTESVVKTFEMKFDQKPMEKRTLLSGSECREDSQKSWANPCVEITEHENIKEIRLPLKPTTDTTSTFNSLVVAMYVTSDDSGLAKPTTSPLAKCKVFTWSRFVIANKGNLPEFSSDIIAILC